MFPRERLIADGQTLRVLLCKKMAGKGVSCPTKRYPRLTRPFLIPYNPYRLRFAGEGVGIA